MAYVDGKVTDNSSHHVSKPRLNLNDLLQRREIEKKVDKKTNFLILSGLSAVGLIILLIFSI